MVTFARAKAKSIFSKLRFSAISKTNFATNKKGNDEERYAQTEHNSKNFFEALKSGGIWLS